jgi:hypothetical protein
VNTLFFFVIPQLVGPYEPVLSTDQEAHKYNHVDTLYIFQYSERVFHVTFALNRDNDTFQVTDVSHIMIACVEGEDDEQFSYIFDAHSGIWFADRSHEGKNCTIEELGIILGMGICQLQITILREMFLHKSIPSVKLDRHTFLDELQDVIRQIVPQQNLELVLKTMGLAD